MNQSWLQLTLIQLGGAICLPLLLLSSILVQSYGLAPAVTAILIGNLLLAMIGVITSRMSVRNRKTTMENAKEYFGTSGGKLFAFIMAFSLTGWFAIQLNVITESVFDFFPVTATPLIKISVNLLLGQLITLTALFGMRSLTLLSNFSAPLLVLTLAYAVYNNQESLNVESQEIDFKAISLIMAASIATVVDMPTYFRHAKSQKDALIATLALFCLAVPLVELAGVYLSLQKSGTLFPKSSDLLIDLWMVSFLIFAGWTTNATNLFSSVACLQSMWPNSKETTRVLLMGFVGSALACFDMLHHFESLLEFMGVAVTAMGAVVALSYLLGKRSNKPAFIAWALGTLAGLGAAFGAFSLTSMAQLDAFIISGISIILLRRCYETADC